MPVGLEKRLISRYLDTDGDGTGTKMAIGNYSDAGDGLTNFFIAPAAEEAFEIGRLLITIEDTKDMKAEEYGDLGSALTNGITIKEVDDSGVITDFTDGVPIKTNAQWGRFYDVDIKSWSATPTNELLVARWTFTRFSHSAVLRLDGAAGGQLVVALNDDFSNLISHTFLAQGLNQVIRE